MITPIRPQPVHLGMDDLLVLPLPSQSQLGVLYLPRYLIGRHAASSSRRLLK